MEQENIIDSEFSDDEKLDVNFRDEIELEKIEREKALERLKDITKGVSKKDDFVTIAELPRKNNVNKECNTNSTESAEFSDIDIFDWRSKKF